MFGLMPRRKTRAGPEMSGAMVPRSEFPLFRNLHEEIDRIFGRFLPAWPEWENGWHWGLDVEEKEEAVIVRAEAPGFEPGDFEVEVRDGYLKLAAVRKTEKGEKEEKGKASEWERRELHETVLLPPGIDEAKVMALYKNGVLTVTLPRAPEAKGRKVPIAGG